MPIYRKGSSGGGGFGLVTLVRTDGTTQVFLPAANSDAARGAALLAAAAAKTSDTDVVMLGGGAFELSANLASTGIILRGSGDGTVIKSNVAATPRLVATLDTLVLESLKVTAGGVAMNGGSLSLRNARIDTSASAAASPIVQQADAGSLELKFSDLRSDAAVPSISSAFNLAGKGAGSTANTAPSAGVTFNDGALLVDANAP
jgi:hypothetical protein